MHRRRWRPVGAGWRSPSRPFEGADEFRARPAHRPEDGRFPDARLPHRRAQEVRPGEGAQVVPVLQALIASLKLPRTRHSQTKGAHDLRPFFCARLTEELMKFFPKTCT